MIGARVDFPFAAGTDDIAGTILLVAKERTAAMNAFLLVGLRGIVWRVRSLRIVRNSTFVCEHLVIIRPIPIGAPFPNVAGHVVKAVTIWRKRFHRGDAGETVFACIFRGKFSLPS